MSVMLSEYEALSAPREEPSTERELDFEADCPDFEDAPDQE